MLKAKNKILGAVLMCLVGSPVLATNYAPQAQLFIPQPPEAPPAQTFNSTVPEIAKPTFQPYVAEVSPAPAAPVVIETQPVTRFTPIVPEIPHAPEPNPAPPAPLAQVFIPQAPPAPVAQTFLP